MRSSIVNVKQDIIGVYAVTEDKVHTALSYAVGVPLSGTEFICHFVIELGADHHNVRHNRKMLDKDQPEHVHI